MPLNEKTTSNVGFIRNPLQIVPGKISSSSRDTGNTGNTTELRQSLTLGIITASGEYAAYAPGASDGTETAVGFLTQPVDLLDGIVDGSPTDHLGAVLTMGAVKASKCIGLDAAAQVDLAGKFDFLD